MKEARGSAINGNLLNISKTKKIPIDQSLVPFFSES